MNGSDSGHRVPTQRCVNLVHDVERRGLVVVQRKDEREAGERLLAAAQVGDVLPTLLGRPHAEHDALYIPRAIPFLPVAGPGV